MLSKFHKHFALMNLQKCEIFCTYRQKGSRHYRLLFNIRKSSNREKSIALNDKMERNKWKGGER